LNEKLPKRLITLEGGYWRIRTERGEAAQHQIHDHGHARDGSLIKYVRTAYLDIILGDHARTFQSDSTGRL